MTARLPMTLISLMAFTLSAYGSNEANDTNASADSQNSEAVEALIQKTRDNMVFVQKVRENTIQCTMDYTEKL